MSDTARDEALFPKLSEDDMACVALYGEEISLQPGDQVFGEGDPERDFYVVREGGLKITRDVTGEEIVLRVHQPGEFTGALSMLTGGTSIATGRATSPTRLIRVAVDDFKRMLTECPPIAATILFAMAERRPEADAMTHQREKLAALGKMSAGLAHELNNPAAAGQRAAGQLRAAFDTLPKRAFALGALCLDDATQERLTEFIRECAERARSAPRLDPLAQSDAEEALADWLEDRGVEDAWDMAPTLAESGLGVGDLEALAAQVAPEGLGPVVCWLTTTLSVGALLGEIEQSTGRIADLVKAIKAYSYMDQAPRQDVDIHQSLDNTLTILNHKLKKGITVVRAYDPGLPRVPAFGSELSQVWTNLIDNAADAMEGRGTLTLHTACEGDEVLVEIGDDGPGIPPEIQPRIFEPFFTTKGVGQGTGLGLDTSYRIVVQHHKGSLCVESKPGDTRFQVRLPLNKTNNN